MGLDINTMVYNNLGSGKVHLGWISKLSMENFSSEHNVRVEEDVDFTETFCKQYLVEYVKYTEDMSKVTCCACLKKMQKWFCMSLPVNNSNEEILGCSGDLIISFKNWMPNDISIVVDGHGFNLGQKDGKSLFFETLPEVCSFILKTFYRPFTEEDIFRDRDLITQTILSPKNDMEINCVGFSLDQSTKKINGIFMHNNAVPILFETLFYKSFYFKESLTPCGVLVKKQELRDIPMLDVEDNF